MKKTKPIKSATLCLDNAIKRLKKGQDVFEYDIYNCPNELKGQLKIGDFSGGNQNAN